MSDQLKPKRFLNTGVLFFHAFRHLKGKWFVAIDDYHYLHPGGIVRRGTIYGGEWTGFFDTEEDALEAIKEYQAKSEVKP